MHSSPNSSNLPPLLLRGTLVRSQPCLYLLRSNRLLRIPPPPVTIVVIGRLAYRKGVDLLVAATPPNMRTIPKSALPHWQVAQER